MTLAFEGRACVTDVNNDATKIEHARQDGRRAVSWSRTRSAAVSTARRISLSLSFAPITHKGRAIIVWNTMPTRHCQWWWLLLDSYSMTRTMGKILVEKGRGITIRKVKELKCTIKWEVCKRRVRQRLTYLLIFCRMTDRNKTQNLTFSNKLLARNNTAITTMIAGSQ